MAYNYVPNLLTSEESLSNDRQAAVLIVGRWSLGMLALGGERGDDRVGSAGRGWRVREGVRALMFACVCVCVCLCVRAHWCLRV